MAKFLAARASVILSSSLQLLTQSFDKGTGLSSSGAIRHETNGAQRPCHPGHNPIPATAPGPLLKFCEMSHHFLGLGADVLIGVMGVHPVPHRLHAGVLLGLDEAAHQLGVFPVTQDVGQAIMGQHLMAQYLAHPLGVGNSVRSYVQGAGIVVKRRSPDKPLLGFQSQGPLKLPLGGVDLHLDTTRPSVLFEPATGNQLSLLAGQVLDWLVALGHRLLGETNRVHGASNRLSSNRGPRIPSLHPALERIHRHRLDGTQALPALLVIAKVASPSGLLVGESHHHLVLVKLSGFGVNLVHHVDHLAFRLIADEHIDMIAISPLGALDVPIVMSHG
ncbi:hypothetical protein VI35_07975 [Aeromonas caviae]|nr:hypothetical protein VI35_07975 [Aeromonas caviae]